MRIVVVKAQSQYGGTRLFADEAVAALQRAGHVAETIDISGEADVAALLHAASTRGPSDLVLSINTLGAFRDAAGRTLGQVFGCPHVVWHTDYILSSWPRLETTPSETVLLVVDPTQVDALHAAAGPERHRTVRFFPHPAVGTAVADEPDVAAFDAARPIPVLWSGGFVKPRRPWSTADKATQKIFDDAVDLATSVEWIPPHVALAQAFGAAGLDVADPDHRSVLSSAHLVDSEVRERRRHAFLLALSKSGIDLHVCGSGWEPHLYRFKTATYHGAVPMPRMVELMRQSRVVLNTNGNFGAGAHERPFSASLAGAAVFSDISRYYETEFRPGENIDLFSWLDLPGAIEGLRALAGDSERCWRYARSAKQVTLARHTWDRQLGDVFDAAGLA